AHERTLPRQLRRHPRAGAPGAAPPHHHELPRAVGRRDDGSDHRQAARHRSDAPVGNVMSLAGGHAQGAIPGARFMDPAVLARVGLVTFDNDVIDFVPSSAKHMEVVLHTLERVNPGRPSSLKQPFQKMAEHFGRRGMLVIISDLYDEPDAVLEAIAPLRFRGNDLIVFHVLDKAELEFGFEDASAFEDIESGEQMPVVPDAFRKEYQSLVRAHLDALQQRFSANRIDYTV